MQPRHLVFSLLVLVSLTLLGAGCGSKTPAATPESTPAATGTEKATSDICSNPYYPFKPGLAITYGVTSGAKTEGNSDYTVRTLSVSGTTAKIRVEMADGGTADMEADCADGSVALNGSSGMNAAAEGMKFETTVLYSNGTDMPANVTAGTTWNKTETIRMDITDGTADMGPITVTTAEQSKMINNESVTVPAGTYQAIKIELTRNTTSTAQLAGGKSMNLPPSTSKSTEWWVKDIGMVKSVTQDENGLSTTEAKSISGN
ncbi:MAG: hypothetical protein ABIB04_05185 [Patescibacteria group bacterium]